MHQSTTIPGYGAARFCFLFIPACFILFILAYHAPDSLFHALSRLDSLIVRTLLSATGLAPIKKGDFVVLGRSCVLISSECSVLLISVPFIAFLIASPLSLIQKVYKALWGITVLILINSMRIGIILMSGMYSQWLMEYVHMVFSRMIMIMVVLALSMYQLPSDDTAPGTAFPVRFIGYAMLILTALSTAWLAVGAVFSRSVIFIVCSLLRLCGYTIHDPAYDSITPMAVGFTGIILFSSLSLASIFLGARPGIRRFMICLFLMVLLQVPAETIGALYFALHVFHDPWIIGLKQIMENLILPLVLWYLLIGKIYGTVPGKGFTTGISPMEKNKVYP